jgi:ankyrin repeat protein
MQPMQSPLHTRVLTMFSLGPVLQVVPLLLPVTPPQAKDLAGDSPLSVAIQSRQLGVAVLLAERAAEMCRLRNNNEETALHVLARTLQRPLPASVPAAGGAATPTRRAIGGGAVVPGDDDSAEAENVRKLVRTLCSVDGVDLEARDRAGQSPLLLAYLSLHGVAAIELIRRGALLTAKNTAGVGILDAGPADAPPIEAETRKLIKRKLLGPCTLCPFACMWFVPVCVYVCVWRVCVCVGGGGV